ncbi:GNAT family N-acetyltransferase [Lysobacter korlensis]|uniref:GNAT family N-acetyltransferase n=1 Tax=Lysobacter korlensis TaxID=553636 RepID=A0ABV6RYE5_9GAMM
MEGAEVTTARSSDVAAIEALVHEAYDPYTERIGGPAGPLEEDYSAIVAAGRALVARREGRIVGLLVTSVHPDHLLVENLAVATSERGRGLGSSLLAISDELARRAGVPEVRLYTHEKMTENLAFYPRRGFRETGRRTEDGSPRVFFARRVDDPHD